MGILNKFLGNNNEKYLKKIQPLVDKINSLEIEFEKFSNEKLKEKTGELKEELKKGKTLDDLLPEAFALVREASKRTLNQRHFDVQLIGGIVLHQGRISEMKTGEGKTLSSTLALYLNALEQKGVHLVTVNDYLAKRDAVWMGQIYYALGLSVGCIMHDAAYIYDPKYQADSPQSLNSDLQPENDKANSTIDDDQNSKRDKVRDVVGGFKVVESYLRPVSRKEAYSADITYGTNNEFGFDYLKDNMAYDLSQQAQRGFNFAIVDEVDSILIDEARTPLIISAPDMESSRFYQEFTGIVPRLNPNEDYEADEKMKAVTLTENGINKVEKILGLKNIYEEKGIKYLRYLEQSLRAQAINPADGKPFFARDREYVVKDGQIIIVDEFTGRLMPGRRWSGGLHQAIEAKEGVKVNSESLTLASITFQNYFRLYKKIAGMTGTAVTSAEEFDKVYGLEVAIVPTNKKLVRQDYSDQIFKTEKGKFQALVREIKKRYENGQPVLVGTTSIEKNEYLGKLLDREGISHQILNAKHDEKEGEIIAQAGKINQVTIATNMAGRGVDIVLGGNPASGDEAKKVCQAGGLHVIGTERHEARRIDNQLRGRAGRQGDAGSSQFFVSLEDDLMRIFGGEKVQSLMNFLKFPEDQPLENNLVSGIIESAQSKIEGMNFDLRKHVLEYDDVLNKHREVIYKKRKEFLVIENWKLEVEKWLKDDEQKAALQKKEEELKENFNQASKIVALRTLDMLWLEHLENMESLRDSVRLRAYGQQDPLIEYKKEGHKMFQILLKTFESSMVNTLLKISLQPMAAPPIRVNKHASSGQKVGRNDPCPCGSGKKYKKCHGK